VPPDTDALAREIRHAVAQGETIVEQTQQTLQRQRAAAAPRKVITPSFTALIDAITSYERAGRRAAAALALTRLRQDHEELNSFLSADEQGWADFVRKRLPLSPERVDELIGGMVFRKGLMHCVKCQVTAIAACGCGTSYVGSHPWAAAPAATIKISATERAAVAIRARPGWSDRAIAAEIGVSNQTVRRARAFLAANAEDVTVDVTVDRRVGRDGRSRKSKRKRK
jgi:hypothetical protein